MMRRGTKRKSAQWGEFPDFLDPELHIEGYTSSSEEEGSAIRVKVPAKEVKGKAQASKEIKLFNI